MTIVKEIVEDHYRGSVELKETVYDPDNMGNGKAVFRVTIPYKEVAPPSGGNGK